MSRKPPHGEDEDFLRIDKYQLDRDWVRQPVLYGYYAEKTAEARQVYDDAKSRLVAVEAGLRLKIMENPGQYDVPKTTEKVVEAAIFCQPEYEEATKEVREAKYAADCFAGLLMALDHKKKALEKLVDLHGRDYFSQPTASSESRSKTDEIERKSTSRRLATKAQQRQKQRKRKLS